MTRLHIGTSGYVYQHWKRIFYPDGLPARRWLDHYCSVFSTVELNATFYRLPTANAVERWRAESPPGFLFACKGSRFLTHMKRLTDLDVGLHRFFDLIFGLRDKLGPVLWQLPPQMKKVELERLERFLAHLPSGLLHAIEFRDAAWYTDEVCDLLDAYGTAFCEHDAVDRQPPRHTGGFRYLRFHGWRGKYVSRYGKRGLRRAAGDLVRWRSEGRDAYVYFNNDLGGHALTDALDLLELTGEPAFRCGSGDPASPPPPRA